MEVDIAGHDGGVETDAKSTKTATPRPADLASSGDAILETFRKPLSVKGLDAAVSLLWVEIGVIGCALVFSQVVVN